MSPTSDAAPTPAPPSSHRPSVETAPNAPPPPPDTRALNRRIWSLSIPAIAESLLQTSLMLVDTWMVSQFGPATIAAASISGVIMWRSHMTMGSIERGTTSMVARYYGAGDHEKVSRTVAQSMMLALLIGVVATIAGGLSAKWLLQAMRAQPDVVALGTPYLTILFLVCIPRMFFFVAAASLRGAGDTRSPMWIMLMINVVHIGFNYPIIFGKFGFPEMRLTGSAISTAIALTLAAMMAGYILFRGRTGIRVRMHHFRPDWPVLRTLLRVSFPALLDEIIISVGFLTFASYIAILGTNALAAHSLSTRIESVSFMVGFGFMVAGATLVGQSLGRKDIPLAKLAMRHTTWLCIFVMSVLAVGLILFGWQILSSFTSDPDVLPLAKMLLLIAAVQQPTMALYMGLVGGLRGAGDTVSPMIASFVGNVVIRAGLAYVLAFPAGLGMVGVYLATGLDWIARCAVLLIAYYSGRWARIKL